MKNGMVYVSAAQHINNALYSVRVPAYAVAKPDHQFDTLTESVTYDQGVKITTISEDPLGYLPASFFQYPSAESRITTGLTIHQIMTFTEDKIDITVLTPEDTIDIFCQVNDYLTEIRDNVFNKESDYVAYAKRMIVFRQEMYFHFRWAIQKNPEWRDYFDRKYTSEYGRGLRALMGAPPEDTYNGVIQLQKPPYTVAEIDALFASPTTTVEEKGRTGNRVSIQDYVRGDRGALQGHDPFGRRSADEQKSVDISNKYL